MTQRNKEELLKKYQPFIWARVYEASKCITTHDVADLYQEASVAFCHAVDRFDPAKGALINLAWVSIKRHFNHIMRMSSRRIQALSLEWSVSECQREIPIEEPAYALADLDATLTSDERIVMKLALNKECKSKRAIVKKMAAEYGWTKYRAQKACKGVQAKLN